MKLLKDEITSHFRLVEFANNEDGGVVEITPPFIEFVQMLEEFRGWYNRPVNILSGYRTKPFNKKVGGASNSLHLKGLAIDFSLPTAFYKYSKSRQNEFLENIKNKWYEICDKHNIYGSVLFYDTWVHIDARTNKRYFEDKRGK